MKAAIYTRVSTEEQARGGVSLDMQEQRCRQAALAAGAETVELFCDDGYTGTDTNRPALRDLLNRLPEFDTLYLWKLDRLTRSQRDWGNLMAMFSEAGCGIASATEPFDFSTPAGRMLMGMLAVVGEFFVDILRENVKAALQHKATQGYHHGPPPYGYARPLDDDGQVIPDQPLQIVPAQAERVRAIYQRYNSGTSLRALTQWVNDRSWPSPGGSAIWGYSSIAKLVRNPAYIGMVRHYDDLYEGLHEPIISDHIWQATQRRLLERRKVAPRALSGSLSALLRCGVCGGHMAVMSGRRPPSYGCAKRKYLSTEQRHPPVGCTRPKLHAIIWAYAEHLLSGDVLAQGLESYLRRRQAELADDGYAELREELAGVEQRIRLNAQYAARNLLPPDMLEQEQGPLIQQRENLRSRLERLELAEVSLTQNELRWLREVGEGSIVRLQAADYGRQRDFLQRLFSHIEVFKDRLVFHHTVGLEPRAVPVPVRYAPKSGDRIIIPPD